MDVGAIVCDGLRLLRGAHGWGVFAARDFTAGETVELGVMYRLTGVDGHKNDHLFTWSDDRRTWAGGSGFLPFYNHADVPNVHKHGDLKADTMRVYALRPIVAGEELRNTYCSKAWRECFSGL